MSDMILRKPPIEVTVRETDWSLWEALFKRWHYLDDAGPMPFSTVLTGYVGIEPVCMMGVSGMVAGKHRVARGCRMVVLPEWMSAGVGTTFLDWVAERELKGEGFVKPGSNMIFHSAHPALCFVLRRSQKWRQISGKLVGGEQRTGKLAWGAHMRAVAGFKYFGQVGVEAAERAHVE